MGRRPQGILLLAKRSADAENKVYTRFERTLNVGGGKSVTVSIDGSSVVKEAVVPCKTKDGKETVGVWVNVWFNYGDNNSRGYSGNGYNRSSYGRTGYRRSTYRRSY